MRFPSTFSSAWQEKWQRRGGWGPSRRFRGRGGDRCARGHPVVPVQTGATGGTRQRQQSVEEAEGRQGTLCSRSTTQRGTVEERRLRRGGRGWGYGRKRRRGQVFNFRRYTRSSLATDPLFVLRRTPNVVITCVRRREREADSGRHKYMIYVSILWSKDEWQGRMIAGCGSFPIRGGQNIPRYYSGWKFFLLMKSSFGNTDLSPHNAKPFVMFRFIRSFSGLEPFISKALKRRLQASWCLQAGSTLRGRTKTPRCSSWRTTRQSGGRLRNFESINLWYADHAYE